MVTREKLQKDCNLGNRDNGRCWSPLWKKRKIQVRWRVDRKNKRWWMANLEWGGRKGSWELAAWQANWSSVWQQIQSCHSHEERIGYILQAMSWILMMLEIAQSEKPTLCHSDPHPHPHRPHSTAHIPPKHSSPQIICNTVRSILNTSCVYKVQHVNINYLVVGIF